MPKCKTNRSAAKRFRKLPGGKIKRAHARTSHNLEHKSRKAKRLLHRVAYVSRADEGRVRSLLPG